MKYILLLVLFSTTLNSEIKIELTKVQKQDVLIVYGSDTCHYCIDTKEYLKEKKIDFIYYDVDVNLEKQKEMIAKLIKVNISLSDLNLPVIDKNGVIFTNGDDFDEFLQKLTTKK